METEANVELAQLDAVQWLRALPSDSIDLLVTDPPYESLEKHRAVGTTTRLKVSAGSSNPWFTVFPNARFPELFAEVYRVLKRNSHFYLMCDQETAFIAKPIAEQAGFKFDASSEINANRRDTADWPKGVWTLPPNYAEGDKDRARYAAIGESDRMTLRFVKPAR